MFRGLYTATSGMLSYERKQQMLSNNLANALTPGYKEETAVFRSFPEMLIQQMNNKENANNSIPINKTIGTLHTGTYMQEGIASFLQGDVRETGKATDFSLYDDALPLNPETDKKGSTLFAVQRGEDILYTRTGEFTVNREGNLVTNNGDLVLDRNLAPINVDADRGFKLEDGQIVQEDVVMGDLWIGYTEDPHKLTKFGQSLLKWEGEENERPVYIADSAVSQQNGFSLNSIVKQGFLEQSNVDVTKTMTEMMATVRMYEANQKVLQAYDRSMEKAVNEIGRL
jgi:flagellar basal-body rod protein FlgF